MNNPLTESEREQLRLVLEEARSALVEQLQQNSGAEAPVELDQNRQGRLSRMDALQGQAMLKAGLQRHRDQLKEIHQALASLDHDEFGRCQQCDDWIPVARLQLSPTAKHCVSCASQRENS